MHDNRQEIYRIGPGVRFRPSRHLSRAASVGGIVHLPDIDLLGRGNTPFGEEIDGRAALQCRKDTR